MEKKFEKELGKRLNERAISPSENAWERVQMQRRKPKKNSPIWPWAAVVAVVLGLFWTMYTGQEPAAVIADQPAETRVPDTMSVPKPVAPLLEQIAQTPAKPQRRETGPVQVSPTQRAALPDVVVPAVETKLVEVLPGAALTAEIAERTLITQPVDETAYFLEKARRELSQGRVLPVTDAHALLKNSESELDQAHRTSTLEGLFKHKRIKIALSK